MTWMLALIATFLISASYARQSRLNLNTNHENQNEGIPDFAIDFAPFVFLHSEESWWPSDISTHLSHCSASPTASSSSAILDLENLHEHSHDVFLTSTEEERNGEWLAGAKPDNTGLSSAPVTIIVVEKEEYTDVFYFYFYSWNQGPTVLDHQYGNHLGDWEYTMIRFVDQKPEFIYLSRHDGGMAYTFDALKQVDGRPIVFAAKGSHANYAESGRGNYKGSVLGRIGLRDEADAGVLWDLRRNFRGYTYDVSMREFASANVEGKDDGSVSWLDWRGRWGEISTGPVAKNLERSGLCEYDWDCAVIRTTV